MAEYVAWSWAVMQIWSFLISTPKSGAMADKPLTIESTLVQGLCCVPFGQPSNLILVPSRPKCRFTVKTRRYLNQVIQRDGNGWRGPIFKRIHRRPPIVSKHIMVQTSILEKLHNLKDARVLYGATRPKISTRQKKLSIAFGWLVLVFLTRQIFHYLRQNQYRIPLKAQKARALGLAPQGASRLRAPSLAFWGF